MTSPLALIYFQSPLVGNQLVNRLQDLQYRVDSTSTPPDFLGRARGGGVMLVLADVEGADETLLETLRTLRTEDATRHIPIIAFATNKTTLDYAQKAGCTIAVEASVLLAHLPTILEQALQLE
jgi:CheY-like chemotaxis protein